MALRSREIIYLTLAVAASVVWVPIAFSGIVFVVGILGLLSIGALFRCICALPVTSNFGRKYFSVAISAGIVLMCGFVLLPAFSGEQRISPLSVLSGFVASRRTCAEAPRSDALHGRALRCMMARVSAAHCQPDYHSRTCTPVSLV